MLKCPANLCRFKNVHNETSLFSTKWWIYTNEGSKNTASGDVLVNMLKNSKAGRYAKEIAQNCCLFVFPRSIYVRISINLYFIQVL